MIAIRRRRLVERRAMSRRGALLVGALALAAAGASCSSNYDTRLEVAVNVDALLALDDVEIKVTATGRTTVEKIVRIAPDGGRTDGGTPGAVAPIRWDIAVSDATDGSKVTVIASGRRGNAPVVTAIKDAILRRGAKITAELALLGVCANKVCPSGETCGPTGACMTIPTVGGSDGGTTAETKPADGADGARPDVSTGAGGNGGGAPGGSTGAGGDGGGAPDARPALAATAVARPAVRPAPAATAVPRPAATAVARLTAACPMCR